MVRCPRLHEVLTPALPMASTVDPSALVKNAFRSVFVPTVSVCRLSMLSAVHKW